MHALKVHRSNSETGKYCIQDLKPFPRTWTLWKAILTGSEGTSKYTPRFSLTPDKPIPKVKTPQISSELLLSLYQKPNYQMQLLFLDTFSEIQVSNN